MITYIQFEELEEELEIELTEENGLPLGFYESKNDLKNVANEHGGEITDETPFADYAPEFDRLLTDGNAPIAEALSEIIKEQEKYISGDIV